MVRILATQLLPLILALLGAILGAALGVFMSGEAPSMSRPWCITIALLGALTVFGVGYLIYDGITLENRVAVLGKEIRGKIDVASEIEYRFQTALNAGQLNQAALGAFNMEIITWRDEVDRFLQKELPESGADIRFRAGAGTLQGLGLYLHTWLMRLQGNLMSVLDNLPSYVQRSR